MDLSQAPTFDSLVVPVVLLFALLAAWKDLWPMIPYVLGKTRYADAVHGRIPNRLVLWWLAFGVIVLGLGALYEYFGGVWLAREMVEFTEGMNFYGVVFLNAGIAFGLGFLLWNLGLWAAGDAKMFALLALTLPLSTYRENYLSYFPSFALFFNTFVAMFLVLLVEFGGSAVVVAWRTRGKYFWVRVKELLEKANENKLFVLRLLLVFLALFTTIRILRHFVREGFGEFMEMNKTIVYVFLFMIFRPIMKLAGKKWAIGVAGLIVVGYGVYAFGFDESGTARYEFINIGWLAISIILFRFLYDAYLKATDEVEIPWSALRRGMILSDESVKKFKEREQFFKEKIGALSPDGIDEEQAGALREWFETNEPEGLVAVARTIPFAPALFIGTVLTLIAHGLIVVL